MRKIKTLEEVYESGLADGYVKNISEVNKDKASSLAENATVMINSAEIIVKALKKEAKEWMVVYTQYYDALRTLTEALIIFDNAGISNHQCLFSYLCIKHPELELDWDFFEKIRTKRNGANYYGEKVSYEDWKETELQFKVYISAIKKEVEKRIAIYN